MLSSPSCSASLSERLVPLRVVKGHSVFLDNTPQYPSCGRKPHRKSKELKHFKSSIIIQIPTHSCTQTLVWENDPERFKSIPDMRKVFIFDTRLTRKQRCNLQTHFISSSLISSNLLILGNFSCISFFTPRLMPTGTTFRLLHVGNKIKS